MRTYRYTNAEKTTIAVTLEDGSEMFVPTDPANRDFREILEAQPEIAEFVPPPPPPAIYSKRQLLGAMTDEEYETFATIEAQQSPREQRMFREAVELNESDPDFPKIVQLLEFAFPEGRAAELLAAAKIR